MATRREKHRHHQARTAQASAPADRWSGTWPMGLLAALLGLALYANTLGHQYTLDDYSVMKENWVVKGGLNVRTIELIFTTEYRYGAWNSPGSLYRPLPLLMFATEWHLWPDDPRPSHAINVLLYALTGLVLWATWRRVLKDQPASLVALAVLLFMAHPVHTEVVANIKSRDEILSLLFGMGALYGIWRHLESGSRGWLAGAVGLYALALFSKESAITLLAVIPLTIRMFSGASSARIVRITLLLALPAVGYLLARHAVLSAQPYPEVYSELDTVYMATQDRMDRLSTAFRMSTEYLRTLVFPHPLRSEMGYPQVTPVGFGDLRALVGIAALGALLVLGLRGLGRQRPLSYAALFFLITYSLFSNIFIIIGTSYGERLMYLPSWGFTLLLALGLGHLFKVTGERGLAGVPAFWLAGTLILVGYGTATVARNPAWYDSATLYATDLPNVPNSAKLNFHHGIELGKQALDDGTSAVRDTALMLQAIAMQDRAVELYPEHADAYHARGQAWLRLGRYQQAEGDLHRAIELRPSYGEAYSNLGVIAFSQGRYEEAEQQFRQALRYDPRLVDAHRNLGAVLATTRRFPEAIAQWQQGLRYDPTSAIMMQFIASAYRDMGRPEQAGPWSDRAARAARR